LPEVALEERSLKFQIAVTIFLLSSLCASQTLTGTVKNGTTGKSTAGDEVVLFALGQGMEEKARSKTDAKGNFSFKLDDFQSPHLIRAIHQEVTYHSMAPPGTTSVAVQVYDVEKKIEGIEVVADVMRMQTAQNQLEFTREFAVQNSSNPPRTQMNAHNLEFYLPAGAKVEEGSAATEHGNPLKTAPIQEEEKNRYSFFFPLRPGTTRFQVTYALPYRGSASIDPRSLYPLQHFVAIVPKSMEFSAANGAEFKAMNDPNRPDANVEVASATAANQTLAFKVSGTGTLQAQVEPRAVQGVGSSTEGASRPDGGTSLDTSDPIQKYRWYIIGAFAGLLLIGATYVGSRQYGLRSGNRAKFQPVEPQESESQNNAEAEFGFEATSLIPTSQKPAMLRPSGLLETLKEEIFRLEVEHKQGEISLEEYQKTKTALDRMLGRALKCAAVKQI
jgi:hypothetical protein